MEKAPHFLEKIFEILEATGGKITEYYGPYNDLPGIKSDETGYAFEAIFPVDQEEFEFQLEFNTQTKSVTNLPKVEEGEKYQLLCILALIGEEFLRKNQNQNCSLVINVGFSPSKEEGMTSYNFEAHIFGYVSS